MTSTRTPYDSQITRVGGPESPKIGMNGPALFFRGVVGSGTGFPLYLIRNTTDKEEKA